MAPEKVCVLGLNPEWVLKDNCTLEKWVLAGVRVMSSEEDEHRSSGTLSETASQATGFFGSCLYIGSLPHS